MLKRVASFLPESFQIELRRLNHRRQISKGLFDSDEAEYGILDKLVSPGDWCLDIGANVGFYTKRMSDIVGPSGRVIAFEPIPEAFYLLTANVQCFTHDNVTLINAAASDCFGIASMTVPDSDNGLPNYYEASINGNGPGIPIITMPVDSIGIITRVSLVKIDAEGHEAQVLAGMAQLILRDKPTLIVETHSDGVISGLREMGYGVERLPDSPNYLFRA